MLTYTVSKAEPNESGEACGSDGETCSTMSDQGFVSSWICCDVNDCRTPGGNQLRKKTPGFNLEFVQRRWRGVCEIETVLLGLASSLLLLGEAQPLRLPTLTVSKTKILHLE